MLVLTNEWSYYVHGTNAIIMLHMFLYLPVVSLRDGCGNYHFQTQSHPTTESRCCQFSVNILIRPSLTGGGVSEFFCTWARTRYRPPWVLASSVRESHKETEPKEQKIWILGSNTVAWINTQDPSVPSSCWIIYSSVSQPLWDRGPANSFFIRRGPSPNRFTRQYLSNFFF